MLLTQHFCRTHVLSEISVAAQAAGVGTVCRVRREVLHILYLPTPSPVPCIVINSSISISILLIYI